MAQRRKRWLIVVLVVSVLMSVAGGTYARSGGAGVVPDASILDTWTPRAPLFGVRGRHVAAANNKVYVFAGVDNATCSRNVEEYNPIDNTWTIRTTVPTLRHDPAVAVVDNKMYVIGGNGCGTSIIGTVEEYDSTNNVWNTRTPMPTARQNLAAAAVGDKIYAIGGRNGISSGSSRFTTVEEYNTTTNSWKTKAPMPTARDGLVAAVVNNKLYAIGGASTATNYLAVVEMYDPARNIWETKASMPTPRGYLSGAVVNNKIYAIGGYNGSVLATVEEYDTETNTWTSRTPMAIARWFFAAAALNNKIYAIGGYNNSNAPLATVEEYQPDITNMPPTAMFIAPTRIPATSPFPLMLINAVDSAADLPTLTYRFDCGSGYGAWSASATIGCPAPSAASTLVHAQVQDQQGALSTYNAAIATIDTGGVCHLGLYEVSVSVPIGICPELSAGPTTLAAGSAAEWTLQLRVWNLDTTGQHVVNAATLHTRVPNTLELVSATIGRGQVTTAADGSIIVSGLTFQSFESETLKLVVRARSTTPGPASFPAAGSGTLLVESTADFTFTDSTTAQVGPTAPVTIVVE